jgi:RNA polymerase sigma-70 factor (ECF subfamily)
LRGDSAPFESTRWTLIARATNPDSPLAQQALEELCRAYWYPLYAFIRRRGHPPDRAEDLTQSFFADILSRGSIGRADRSRGRFRTFLLGALNHFLANTRQRAGRAKWGGKVKHVSLDVRDAEDRYVHEPAHGLTPERLFERRWALTVLDRALERLEREMKSQGKRALFQHLKPSLTGDLDQLSHAEIGAALNMNEGAVRVAAHRVRKRYRELLRDEVAQTVDDPADIAEEIRELFVAVRFEGGPGPG